MHHTACAVPNRSETSINQNFRLKGKAIKRNIQNERQHQSLGKNSLNVCLLSNFKIYKKNLFTF